jgi:hypothetical protein
VINVKEGPESDPGHAVSGTSLEMASVSSNRSTQDAVAMHIDKERADAW